MNKQLSFIHEGKRYMTLFGADEYLSSALPKDSNVVECSVIQASGGYNASFKKTFGMEVRNVPIIQDPKIDKNGAIYIVTGTAEIDGASRNVRITAIGNVIEGLETAETKVSEEESTETVEVVKKSSEEIKEIKEEKVTVVEETNKETDSVSTPDSSFMNEPVETKEESSVVSEEIKKKPEPVKEDFMNKPTLNKKVVKAGMHFGEPNADGITGLVPGLVIGGESNNSQGFVLSGIMYSKNKSSSTRTFSDKLYNRRAKQEIVKKKPVVKEEVEELKEKRNVIGKTIPLQQTAPTVETKNVTVNVNEDNEPKNVLHTASASEIIKESKEISKEEPADNKALKEKLRAEFSQEVNNVIGKIPLDILGAISEFTMNSINAEALSKNGELYCIDNRWHKCGKWYCIDVVNNASRYFFNAKLNINIEIPIKNCKDWLNAISKQEVM